MISQTNSNYDLGFQQPKPVFTLGNCEVWGGSELYAHLVPDLSAFIHLTDLSYSAHSSIVPIVSLNDEARLIGLGDLAPAQVPTVSVDWPDGSIPFVDKLWWTKLTLAVMQLDRVLISCAGGTGRTGTALAILASKMAHVEEPVQWIRSHYSVTAIETASQIAYLRKTINYEGDEVGSHEVDFLTGWAGGEKPLGKPRKRGRK